MSKRAFSLLETLTVISLIGVGVAAFAPRIATAMKHEITHLKTQTEKRQMQALKETRTDEMSPSPVAPDAQTPQRPDVYCMSDEIAREPVGSMPADSESAVLQSAYQSDDGQGASSYQSGSNACANLTAVD